MKIKIQVTENIDEIIGAFFASERDESFRVLSVVFLVATVR